MTSTRSGGFFSSGLTVSRAINSPFLREKTGPASKRTGGVAPLQSGEGFFKAPNGALHKVFKN